MSADAAALSLAADTRFGPGRWIVLLPGDPTTALNTDTGDSFAAGDELVELLRLEPGWTRRSVAERGLPLAVADLVALVEAGLVEPVGAPAASLDRLASGVLRAGSLDVGRSADAPMSSVDAVAITDAMPIALPAPAELDESLGRVLAARRSRRRFASAPLSLDEVSTLLHHAARLRSGSTPVSYPYAAAGARNELSIILLADRVLGLQAGPHFYDPAAHTVTRMSTYGREPDHGSTISGATGGLVDGPPAARLVLVSEVAELTDRYGRRGVALAYANLGSLVQTLYLVGAALGLAVCAVGGARQREDCRWLDLDPSTRFPLGYLLIGPPQR